MSQLLPEGVTLADCPFPLHGAILAGLRALGYEEFPKEERPPRRIWTDGPRLDEWWRKVEAEREAKYGTTPEPDEGDFEMNAVELVSRG